MTSVIGTTRRRINDWSSAVLDAILTVGGWLYRPLYWYSDRYEHLEFFVIVVELGAIAYGLELAFNQEISSIQLSQLKKELTDSHFLYQHFVKDHFKDLVDLGIFPFLAINTVARLTISLRGHSLGYAYGQIERLLHGKLDIDDVYARVKRAPWGYSPAGKKDANALTNYAGTIANSTSALLSLRTYHGRDKQWLTRDHDSLLDWFTSFPAALWRLVPEDESDELKSQASANENGGYYSVIVPTTAASAKHICRGQMATDLAEVDPKIADTFGMQPIEAIGSNAVEFLAYVHMHIPRYRREQLAEELLFATSIQHVAFLLHGIFGAADNFRAKWNFVIFLEAANSRHGRILERLGFVALAEKAHERSDEPTGPGKSYAGFPLFELRVMSGQPRPDPKNPKAEKSKAYAEKFVRFLEDLTVTYRDRRQHGASELQGR